MNGPAPRIGDPATRPERPARPDTESSAVTATVQRIAGVSGEAA